MRLVFDASSMPSRPAGAGRVMRELGRALAGFAAEHPILLLDRFGTFDDVAGLPGVSLGRVPQVGRLLRFGWEQSALPFVARRYGADVLHGLHHSLPLLRTTSATVVTVHDVTFDVLPRRYTSARRWYMRAITRLGLLRADRIIVPSSWVRSALIRRYGAPAERVHVVPWAPAPGIGPVEDRAHVRAIRERYGLPDRYLLSVGTLEPGKNRQTLVRALDLLQRRGRPQTLAVVGQRGWLESERVTPEPPIDIRYLGYVPDADLPALYTGAAALLFSSWLEGFGLPSLEALACGTPVISSNRPAMTEVLGDAVLYADPRDAREWAGAVEMLCDNRGLRDRLLARGLDRAARYSWRRAARETLDVYAAALGAGGEGRPQASPLVC
jgi:glycosyltransferase involved in cell wall biosynthesis